MNQVVLKGLLARTDADDMADSDRMLLRSAILEQVDQAAAFERDLAEKAAEGRARAKAIMEAVYETEQQREKFLGLIREAMQTEGFEKLPGEKYEAIIKANPPKLVIDQDPSEFDAEAYPTLVKSSYSWDKTRIKALIAMDRTIPWARIVTETRVEFKRRAK